MESGTPLAQAALHDVERAHPAVQAFLGHLLAPRPSSAPAPSLKGAPVSRGIADLAAGVASSVAPSTGHELQLYHLEGSGVYVFYYLTGHDATTEDTVHLAAESIHQAWQDYLAWGFEAPQTTAPDQVHIYIRDLDGSWGVAYAETFWDSAYIELTRDFSGALPNDDPISSEAGQIRTISAHELFHLVQYNMHHYSVYTGDGWYQESTAEFIEDEVFDGVNQYLQRLPEFYDNTHQSLWDVPGGGYQTVLINKFLKEAVAGGDLAIIRQVLEGIGWRALGCSHPPRSPCRRCLPITVPACPRPCAISPCGT
jgi:hypothetical protein